jgi:hypothetical protein
LPNFDNRKALRASIPISDSIPSTMGTNGSKDRPPVEIGQDIPVLELRAARKYARTEFEV